MPVYNMITGLNAEPGTGQAAIKDFGFEARGSGTATTRGVEEGAFLKSMFQSTGSSGGRAGSIGMAVGVSPPFCVSVKTERFDNRDYGRIGFMADDAEYPNGLQFSEDHSQVRVVEGASGYSPWAVLPAPWRDGEPNTIEFSVGSEGGVAFIINGEEVPGLGMSLPTGNSLYFGLGWTELSPGCHLSMGQIVISGAPLLAYDIPVLRPSADRTSVGFTPDTGTEMFSRINETVPDGDASYVSASYGGDNALFRYTDADGNALELDPAQTVKAIKHTTQAKLDEAGNRDLASVYQDGGNAEVTAGSVGVTGEYALRSQIIEVNPLTGVAWQPDDFADWSFGFQIVEE